MLHCAPKSFNRIEVRTRSRPFQTSGAKAVLHLLSMFRTMSWCTILHKVGTIGRRALDFRTVKWCKNWFGNVLDVGFRCDFSSRLFPNHKPVSNNCSPNHYMRELLELRSQTVLMILFSWVTGNPHIVTETSNIESSLISPNNPHPVLHRPMFMILGPSKARFFILLPEAWLGSSNSAMVAFHFESLTNKSL